ncbi:MAG: NAD(P)-dependent oxidoreductase [Gammaproteobacteria bacterium]|uniref:NAD(P)-dependent oxidoreductase n=1 Tax=OM182 bacterium MED-G24 TaxID=1986255 RepID=A0A2A5WHG1_9GAMM|nr:NAD(P)-dependent oxidoreductase [Gammaproteobacteria bacterium]PDH35708.1 MAG: NAD(P)-dependent oxidoreductase [OM182 bacterium MED-G24]RPG25465.1 MAG: SDR family NAD(P)-dependent oxidoreductase [Gammaproteobacteria bacterium TMED50]
MTGTVFITGASSGFGAAAAERFAREGWQVVMVARRQDRLDELKQSMPHPDRIHTVVLDVRDGDAVTNAVAELPDPFSGINILVNNAGLALGMEGADQAVMDDWETMVDTNIKGLMYVTRAVLPGMVARGGGHVVNIGSVAASWPYPGGNAYGGTKAFVQQFSRNLRADLLGKNIRVTNVEPGMCETEFSVVRFKGDEDKASQVYDGMQPLTGVDVAELIYWVTQVPAHVNINQLEVMPVNQTWSPFAVHREG